MSLLVSLGEPAVGFYVSGDDLFILSGRELIKADKLSGEIKARKEIFSKDGNARFIRGNTRFIAVSDFCELYVFDAASLDKLGEWTLGCDLSSDICRLYVDDDHVYAAKRNGGITRLDLRSFTLSGHSAGESSSWAMTSYRDTLIAGTVSGEIMFIEKASMEVKSALKLSRQNIRSLCVCGDRLLAASQDKKLFMIDLNTREMLRKITGVHTKMYDIAGVSEGRIYTLSHPCAEIRVWLESGELINARPFPLRLSGDSYIDGGYMYISSRIIPGIERLDLQNDL